MYLRITVGKTMRVIQQTLLDGNSTIFSLHDSHIAAVMALVSPRWQVKGKPNFASFMAFEIND
jgi:hypothetical protein